MHGVRGGGGGGGTGGAGRRHLQPPEPQYSEVWGMALTFSQVLLVDFNRFFCVKRMFESCVLRSFPSSSSRDTRDTRLTRAMEKKQISYRMRLEISTQPTATLSRLGPKHQILAIHRYPRGKASRGVQKCRY